MTMDSAQFQEAIKRYLIENHINGTQLADKVGKPVSTVGDWIRNGIKRERDRKRIIEEFPWLFDSIVQPLVIPDKVPSNHSHQQLLVMIKIEQASPALHHLKAILEWFLFHASAQDRDHFRKSFGDDWKNFLELTRAMTGETAFEVTKQEGRLEWCQK